MDRVRSPSLSLSLSLSALSIMRVSNHLACTRRPMLHRIMRADPGATGGRDTRTDTLVTFLQPRRACHDAEGSADPVATVIRVVGCRGRSCRFSNRAPLLAMPLARIYREIKRILDESRILYVADVILFRVICGCC